MRNINRAVAVAATATLMAFLGCDGNRGRDGGSKRVTFVTKYAPIEFSFPDGWYTNPKDNPFDLQCMSRNNEMNTGVFVFKKADLAPDSTPTDKFREQVDDMKSKRKNFKEMESIKKQEYEDKSITSITYAGDKDSSSYCYTFSLVEFRGNDSLFAVLLQVSLPEDWKKNKPVLESIVQSARIMPADGAEVEPSSDKPK